MNPLLQALLVTACFLGLYLQLAALTGRMLRTAQGGPDCRKGAKCARCLAESEAIRVKPENSERSAA